MSCSTRAEAAVFHVYQRSESWDTPKRVLTLSSSSAMKMFKKILESLFRLRGFLLSLVPGTSYYNIRKILDNIAIPS